MATGVFESYIGPSREAGVRQCFVAYALSVNVTVLRPDASYYPRADGNTQHIPVWIGVAAASFLLLCLPVLHCDDGLQILTFPPLLTTIAIGRRIRHLLRLAHGSLLDSIAIHHLRSCGRPSI